MGLFKSIRDGLNALHDKRARNQQIDEELESYLGESINEKMRRGMSPEDAIRAARAEVGSAEVVNYKVWNAGWESTADTDLETSPTRCAASTHAAASSS